MEEISAIVIFGKHLKKLREEAGFTLKSFAYQLDLENREYLQVEEGIDVQFMTPLRSDIAPRLLHINDDVSKRETYYKFYRAARDLHHILEEEKHKEYIRTLTPEVIAMAPAPHVMNPENREQIEIQSIVNEMEGI